MAKKTDNKIIPLNLIFDYPVYWSEYKVLRDFVQNFYDSVGYNDWHKFFKYTYKNNVLVMAAENVSFSYEWLLHIGASTKRGSDTKNYAGYFGEGFKIAALNAVRDYHWQVSARSSNWRINVITSDLTIDGKKLKSLAYEWEECDFVKDTSLEIRNIFVSQDLLNAVMLSFYYEENILIGEKIWESTTGVIAKRSSAPLPENYITTSKFGNAGIIFASFQALGSINLPLVFCHHTFKKGDRDRSGFYDFDVIDMISDLVHKIDAESSFVVLEYFARYWRAYPKKKYDIKSFYNIICTLVSKLSKSPDCVKKFLEKYPNLLVTHNIAHNDLTRINRRSQALAWARLSSQKYKFVQSAFEKLGYPLLESKCEEDGGFTIARLPNELEKKYIQVLEQCTYDVFGEFFGFKKLPDCMIINNEKAVWKGMANCFKRTIEQNSYGHELRYTMNYIALKHSAFNKSSFANAYATYLHELTHVFGGDSSANYSRALSDVLEIQLQCINIINKYAAKWRLIN
ncbi:MAG: hypothetical protein LBC02_12465 [Planctomycetaceae bacterium]|jgi:hypothetical protein|nr:hypothetical protein [Planctomycetaceae bacterium]